MADIITSFGNYICKSVPGHPGRSRKLLLTAYRANGIGIRLFPDRRLSPARRFAVNYINDAVIKMLAHPQQSALVNVFMPCELLHAMDITPMCAEMYSSYINGTKCERIFAESAEAEGISETFCSYHKILTGSAYSGVLPAPSMVVNCSLICDANNLTFRDLSDHFGIPHYYIDVPKRRSEDSVNYVADQFRELASFLEEQTGKPLDYGLLKENVARSGRTIQQFRKCLQEKKNHFLPSDIISEINEVYFTHNALGTREAEDYANRLLKDLLASPEPQGIKLLWLNAIPVWQSPVKKLLDFNPESSIAACSMNLDCLLDMDPDHPFESMARRLVYSSFNTGQAQINAALKDAETLDADGVVCFCNWGCKQSMGISAMIKETLEKEGFPTLILDGDACDRRNASDGQTETRLEAFLEMLQQNKNDE